MKVFPTPTEKLFSWMVKVLFYALKIIGLAPFSILFRTLTRNSRNTSIKLFLFSRMGLLYNLVLATLIQIVGVLGISNCMSLNYPTKSSLNQGLDVVQYILPVFSSSFIVVYLAFRQQQAVVIMNRLLDVHFLLYRAREHLFVERMHISLSLQMAFHIFLWVTTLSVDILVNPFSSLVATHSIHVIVYFVLIEYSIILGVVAREIEIVNQILSNLNDFPSYSSCTSLPHEHPAILSLSTHSQLTTLKLLHSIRATLFDLSQNIADLFSLPILFCIACAFFSLIECLYFMTMLISMRDSFSLTMHYINIVTWILIFITPLIVLAFNVTETMKKARLTGRIVHTLLATSKKQEIITELEQFSLHLIHEDVRFTAYGFFTLDFTLLQSIFGATATYLVIVLQFVQSPNNHR